MLAVAIATAASRGLSYGTIYTTKLLRRGTDIDRPAPAEVLADMTVGDAMRPLEAPPPAGLPALLGMTAQARDVPDTLLATESLQHALRQLAVHGRDGLPVLDSGSGRPRGWVTSHDVLQALTRTVTATETADARAGAHAGDDCGGLPGYQVREVTLGAGAPAAGRRLGDTAWPPGWIPVSVQGARASQDAEPGLVLQPGDRVSLLAPRSPAPRPGPTSAGAQTGEGDGRQPAGIPGAAGRPGQ
jgi:CIC family chloride channel protein